MIEPDFDKDVLSLITYCNDAEFWELVYSKESPFPQEMSIYLSAYRTSHRFVGRRLRLQAEDLELKYPQGFVYLMLGGNGLFKIGFTRNLSQRLIQLRTQTRMQIECIHLIASNEPEVLERQLQYMYWDYRVRGEWFALDEISVAEIKEIPYNQTIKLLVRER